MIWYFDKLIVTLLSNNIGKSSDILYRPLIMLYREKIKTTENIAYYIIKITDSETYMYKELDDAPEEIKNKLISIKYNSGDSLLSDSI